MSVLWTEPEVWLASVLAAVAGGRSVGEASGMATAIVREYGVLYRGMPRDERNPADKRKRKSRVADEASVALLENGGRGK